MEDGGPNGVWGVPNERWVPPMGCGVSQWEMGVPMGCGASLSWMWGVPELDVGCPNERWGSRWFVGAPDDTWVPPVGCGVSQWEMGVPMVCGVSLSWMWGVPMGCGVSQWETGVPMGCGVSQWDVGCPNWRRGSRWFVGAPDDTWVPPVGCGVSLSWMWGVPIGDGGPNGVWGVPELDVGCPNGRRGSR